MNIFLIGMSELEHDNENMQGRRAAGGSPCVRDEIGAQESNIIKIEQVVSESAKCGF